MMIGFCTAFASAATPVWLLRAKAGIAAAMMAANISFEALGAAQGQAIANAIDPLGIVQTVGDTRWEEYIDQSVIVVRPDYVTIDGQEYSEIWLGSDAANALRASGFDFRTAYNLLDNQGTPVSYASGTGYIHELPIYFVNGDFVSQEFWLTDEVANAVGDFTVTPYSYSGGLNRRRFRIDWSDGDYSISGGSAVTPLYTRIMAKKKSGGVPSNFQVGFGTGYNGYDIGCKDTYVADPFNFAYTSGNVDATPIPPDEGLLLRVPSSYDSGDPSSPYNYDIHDIVNTYPAVNDPYGHELVFDPSLNPDFDVDVDMGNVLGDLITAVILAKIADLLGDKSDFIYAPMPDKPEPAPVDPDTPDPDVPIGDQDPIWLDNLLRWIKTTIDNLGDRIHNDIDSIKEVIQDILDSIEEMADKILEDIELGPTKLFDKAIDILKTLFLPLLLPIRAMMNLWHYVVEWIQSVSSPFTWIFGVMSGTSYNMVLPIYALLSGGICISIYKALGR